MADGDDEYQLPKPEPKEIDEKLSLQLRHLAEDAVLRGQPNGEERCDNCLYYIEPEREALVLLASRSCASSSVATGGASGGKSRKTRRRDDARRAPGLRSHRRRAADRPRRRPRGARRRLVQ